MTRLSLLFCSNLQRVSVELRLDVPWLPEEASHVGDLLIGRGSDNALIRDGRSVPVHILDPASFLTVEPLIFAAQRADVPNRLVLVAGHVPMVWRGALREAGVSFACDDGAAEVTWPGRIKPSPRLTLTLPRWEALLAQELIIAAADGRSPTCGELAGSLGTGVHEIMAAAGKLTEHGLAQLPAEPAESAAATAVTVTNVTALADALAHRTAWPGSHKVVGGFVWGKNIWDIAARISRDAAAAGIDLAVTGRAAAAFFGAVGPAARSEVWCWADAEGRSLADIARNLKLEPAPWDEANVMVAADSCGVGTRHRASADSGGLTATVAHPLRVWCDLHHEGRGLDLAGKFWPRATILWLPERDSPGTRRRTLLR